MKNIPYTDGSPSREWVDQDAMTDDLIEKAIEFYNGDGDFCEFYKEHGVEIIEVLAEGAIRYMAEQI